MRMLSLSELWGARRFRIEGDVISGQSFGCALSVQVRYTRFLWFPQWAHERKSALLDIKIFAPKHDPETGYRCVGFRFKVGW